MTTFQIPASASPSGNATKRYRSLDLEGLEANIVYNEGVNVTVPKSTHRNELTTALVQNINANNYSHNLIPTDVSDALTKFLMNTKLSAEHSYFIGVNKPTSDESILLKSATERFKDLFKEVKLSLCNGIKGTPAENFLRKLDGNDMTLFRGIRSRFTKWFVSAQHLLLKLDSTSHSRDYVKMHFNISSDLNLPDLRKHCNTAIANLKEELEIKLTLAKVEECLTMTEKIKDELTTSSSDDALLYFKAFRAIILNNKALAKELINFIPKGPTLRAHHRPPVNKRFNRRVNYRRNDDERHHVDVHRYSYRSDRNDPREEPQRRNYRHYRDYRPVDRPIDDRRFDDRRHPRRNHESYRDRLSTYDEDFPPYDKQYKQKRTRYLSDDDEVFDLPRRPSYRY
jgi:hypothetical protein